jgi:methylase of polypeptide subunit release factors
LLNAYKHFIFNGLDLIYTDKLDGGGSAHANLFIPFIKSFNRKFNKCLEMFSGAGITSLILLSFGLCNYVDMADINPQAITFAKTNIKLNKLENKPMA